MTKNLDDSQRYVMFRQNPFFGDLADLIQVLAVTLKRW